MHSSKHFPPVIFRKLLLNDVCDCNFKNSHTFNLKISENLKNILYRQMGDVNQTFFNCCLNFSLDCGNS